MDKWTQGALCGFLSGLCMGLLGSQYVNGFFGSLVAFLLSLLPWVALTGITLGLGFLAYKAISSAFHR